MRVIKRNGCDFHKCTLMINTEYLFPSLEILLNKMQTMLKIPTLHQTVFSFFSFSFPSLFEAELYYIFGRASKLGRSRRQTPVCSRHDLDGHETTPKGRSTASLGPTDSIPSNSKHKRRSKLKLTAPTKRFMNALRFILTLHFYGKAFNVGKRHCFFFYRST